MAVLHDILQYCSAFSNVMFDNQTYIDAAFVLKMTQMMTS